MTQKQLSRFLLCCASFFALQACGKKISSTNAVVPPADTAIAGHIDWWLTTGDQSALLQKQAPLAFTNNLNSSPTIRVDTTFVFQTIDGFGYSLTGGSAYLINGLSGQVRANLLKELFGRDSNSIGVSYLRISIGASDLDSMVFSYDDLPTGETDLNLDQFSLDPDRKNLIPVLKEILTINPGIKIMGSPWSPPVWMKDNGNSKGGSLLPRYYNVYAQYFVKYIQEMKAEGITIDAITPQNEPLHPGNNPSMLMLAEQERDFIKNNLGPAFRDAGLTTKIIVYDHNLDRPDYPLTILNDPEANKFVDGSAFHLYGGKVDALETVHNAYPDKNLYFTEQWTGSNESFDNNLMWHVKNVIIGTMRNWCRIVLEWNLASDPDYKPHTPGGCDQCKGALTIDADSIRKRASYYILAHASKFVPPGSVRINSNVPAGLDNVAFKTAEGKKILIVLNDNSSSAAFNIQFNVNGARASIPPHSVATYVW